MSSSATKPTVWYGCVCGLMDSTHMHTQSTAAHLYLDRQDVDKQTVAGLYMCLRIRMHTHTHTHQCDPDIPSGLHRHYYCSVNAQTGGLRHRAGGKWCVETHAKKLQDGKDTRLDAFKFKSKKKDLKRRKRETDVKSVGELNGKHKRVLKSPNNNSPIMKWLQLNVVISCVGPLR